MDRIISLTPAGHRLAQKLQERLPGSEVWHKPKPFGAWVRAAFSRGDRLIMVCATGIVVRCLAPALGNKQTDPPVLVLDETGRFVIPLVSGHQGGANHWGQQIAEILGAQLVITTAGYYLQPVYTVGMGCERHCEERELAELLAQCIEEAGIQRDDFDSINSIDLKADEMGLVRLAESLDKPFRTWSASQLQTVESLISSRSEYVFKIVGVHGVAETAALYSAKILTDSEPELVLPKRKSRRATCSIARSYLEP